MGSILVLLGRKTRHIVVQPMLYLSAYLKAHQQEYYDRLTQVRVDGNFEAWTRFFLEGVVELSRMVLDTTRRIQALERNDVDRLVEAGEGTHGLKLLRGLMKQPVVMANDVAKIAGVSYTKANEMIATCERLGLLQQISKGKRNRKFMYQEYVKIVSEGTDL